MTNVYERTIVKKHNMKVINDERFETAKAGGSYITKVNKVYYVWTRDKAFLGYTYNFESACLCALEYERSMT